MPRGIVVNLVANYNTRTSNPSANIFPHTHSESPAEYIDEAILADNLEIS